MVIQELFKQKTAVLVNQYSEVEILPGVHANGELSLGENIADHGGVSVAYTALHNALKGKEIAPIDGLTADQRFFIAYSQVWAANITDAEIRNRTKSDPHSLGMWRVNGALPHINMWYDAFNVKPTDKLFVPADQRLKLW